MAAESGGALGGLVRQLSIDQFENEGRRVSCGTPESASHARRLLDRQTSVHGVQKKVCLVSFIRLSKLFLYPFLGQFGALSNGILLICWFQL